ncbi:MAG: TIGR00730 family Rossman fold protein [Hyphomicrobiaceae bacterium]
MQKQRISSRKRAPGPAQATSKPVPRRNVCVFCGSGAGRNPAYAAAAETFGRSLAAAGIGLVYGGGSLGLMGEVARATLAAGGRVTGIIPAFLSKKERMLTDVDELIVTDDMHERKRLMFERSDAFVALPGGIGTLEELVEQMTWAQLGRHDKPVVIASIEGFWSPLLRLVDHMRDEAFIRPGLEVRVSVVETAEEIVPLLERAFAAGASMETGNEAVIEKL